MKMLWKILFLFVFCIGSLYGSFYLRPKVLIKTELGDIEVEIYEKKAPITASNFLKYVDEKLFEGASFYRVVTMDNQPNNDVKIEVIQGGLRFTEGKKTYPEILHETTDKTGLFHKDSTISMARLEPGTASSEIFICIGDQPELDFGGKRNPDGQGFAAFGKVTEGMDVVREIQRKPADEQMLKSRIRIHTIVRVKE
ncbi:peptidylprolyl isomerase [Acidobacteriota bacterium]